MSFKIVSGGQTGVDRAALDTALELGIQHGGWCPKGRLAEDGKIPEKYALQECPTSIYAQRTEWNVRDSDVTLIIAWGAPQSGTLFTLACVKRLQKPHFVCDMLRAPQSSEVVKWIHEQKATIINIAGPRASFHPDVYAQAKDFLLKVFGD